MKPTKTPWGFYEFSVMEHTYYNIVRFGKNGKTLDEIILQVRMPTDDFMARKLKANLLFIIDSVN